jgi:hypothetical protein
MRAATTRTQIPRAAPRRKVFHPATLETADGRQRAHLLNLSAVGACLHVQAGVRIWSAVVIQAAGQTVAARVTWADGQRCGVKFVTPLDAATLAAMTA